MLPEISSALSAIKNAVDLLKLIVSSSKDVPVLNSAADIQKIIISLQSHILSLQERIFSLHDENSSLKRSLDECKEEMIKKQRWNKTARCYEFFEFSPGAYAHLYKHKKNDTTPAHKACSKCFSEQRLSILQSPGYSSAGRIYKCHLCGSELIDHNDKPPSIPAVVKIKSKWDAY